APVNRAAVPPVTIAVSVAEPPQTATESAYVNLRGPDGQLRRFAVEGGREALSSRVGVLRPGESVTIRLTAGQEARGARRGVPAPRPAPAATASLLRSEDDLQHGLAVGRHLHPQDAGPLRDLIVTARLAVEQDFRLPRHDVLRRVRRRGLRAPLSR